MSTITRLHASKKTIRVHVTSEHIEKATKGSSSHCMIADAIKSADKNLRAVSVDLGSIRVTDPKKNQRYIYLTPPIAQVALVRFDHGLEMTPFSFALRSPAQVVKANVGANTGKPTKKKSPTRKKQGVRTVSASKVPVRLGGTVFPKGVLGKKRAFGLRATSAGLALPTDES